MGPFCCWMAFQCEPLGVTKRRLRNVTDVLLGDVENEFKIYHLLILISFHV